MSETSATCPECGAELPEGIPASRCPQCLIGLALAIPGQPAVAGVQSSELSDQSAVGTNHRSPITRGTFGDYELLEEIAHGGMGVVWKARQKSLDRLVAVKLILAGEFATPQFVQRFRTEASAAAVLHHPNIVAIHEVGVHAGQHYFSMDFVAGPSLAALVGRQPLPARRAAHYLKTIAEAIHYAHEQGILHRDLKPSNVLIDANDQPRITDFGLAKRLEGETSLMLSGQMVGSPNFMPPEQATARHGKVGRYSDVYALGGILYHLLTARPPFQADSLEIIVSQVLTAEPVSPRLLNSSVPRDLETICLKCLEKESHRRYPTAEAVAEELERFLEGKPIRARPASLPERSWRWCRRQPVRASLIGALLLVFSLGLSGVLWALHEARAAELFSQQNTYAAEMYLAQLALENNNVGLTRTLLNKHRPRASGKSATDFRNWEWRHLWQLSQGDEANALQQRAEPIRLLTVAKDERPLALRSSDRGITVWDLNSGRLLAEFTNAAFGPLTLSTSGKLLAFCTRDANGKEAIEIRRLPAGELESFLTQRSFVKSLAFSPDETHLAIFDGFLDSTGNDHGRATVVALPSTQVFSNAVAPPRRPIVGVVAFSPDGKRLAIGEDYGGLRIVDAHTWRTEMEIMTTTSDGVAALAWSPNGNLLAVGFAYDHKSIWLWDPRTGESRGELTCQAWAVRDLAFSPNGQFLAAPDEGETIRVWQVAEPSKSHRFRAYRGGVNALAFLPDSKTLLSAGNDGAIRPWDVTAPGQLQGYLNLTISYGFPTGASYGASSFVRGALPPGVVCRYGCSFAPDGHSFLAPDKDGFIEAWDARSLRRIGRLPVGSNHWDVAISPDSLWLATGENEGTVTVWDGTGRRAVTNFALPFEWFGRMYFSRSGGYLFANSVFHNRQCNWRMWRTNDWQEMPLPGDPPSSTFYLDLSPDDRLLAIGYANGEVKLWDFPGGQPVATFGGHSNVVYGVRFSHDGRTLASTSGDPTTGDSQVKLWDVAAQRELGPFPNLSGGYNLDFSPDDRRLATSGHGGKDPVKVWDLVTHQQLLALQGEGQFFFGIDFSPDGNTLIAVSLDGKAHVWRAPTLEEIAAVEKKEVAP